MRALRVRCAAYHGLLIGFIAVGLLDACQLVSGLDGLEASTRQGQVGGNSTIECASCGGSGDQSSMSNHVSVTWAGRATTGITQTQPSLGGTSSIATSGNSEQSLKPDSGGAHSGQGGIENAIESGTGAYAGAEATASAGTVGRGAGPSSDGGRGNSAGEGTAGASAAAAGAGCAGPFEHIATTKNFGPLCVAKQVRLPEEYAIDSTEVSVGQYRAWLALNPQYADANVQPLVACRSWHKYFAPPAECASHASVFTGQDSDHHPVACVDWCDAYAYCHAVGKRMCGATRGGSLTFGQPSTGASSGWSVSQWLNACSSGGITTQIPTSFPWCYPYGREFDRKACNGRELELGTTHVVGSSSTCQSPYRDYSGIYDLSGNVAEWEDSCWGYSGDQQAQDICRTRGGAFDGDESSLGCGFNGEAFRMDTSPGIGFRCCSVD